jgi:hypothetical protein
MPSYGVVSGSLVWNDLGSPTGIHSDNPGGAVLLLPRSEAGTTTPLWYEVRRGEDGRFRFDRVRPGAWRLLAHVTDHRLSEQDVDVPSGPLELPPIRLVRAESEAMLQFTPELPRPESRGGRTLVRLRLAAAGRFARAWIQVDIQDFWDLPAADFEMSEIGMDRSPQARPLSARVSVPPGDLSVQAIGAPEASNFSFDVHDEAGSRVDAFGEFFGPRGSVFGRPARSTGGGFDLIRDAPLNWCIFRDGFAPAFGDERSFVEEDKRKVAHVKLARGWGASLLFRAGNPSEFESDPWPWNHYTFPAAAKLVGPLAASPLPGMRVEVDGNVVATSDEEGEARLQLDAMPPLLTLRSEGWKMVAVQPAQLGPQYLVWMDRE